MLKSSQAMAVAFRHVRVPPHPTGMVLRRLEAEADEMWSFVKKRATNPWIWMAMDATTRQVLAFHVGGRSRDRAKELWAKIPLVYQERATYHTDQYDAYIGVIPAERHKAMTNKSLKHNHIEGFNHTLREGVPRLVRETLSFSKKLVHHIDAHKYFMGYDNLMRTTAAALPV